MEARDYKETIRSRAWKGRRPPRKILVIRYQALGDVFATFPFVSDLRTRFPEAQIDLIVREDYADLPARMSMFHKVYPLRRTGSGWGVLRAFFRLWPRLFFTRYDVVLDLQRNRQSRFFRRTLIPKAWAEFDRFSPVSVVSRVQWSVEQLGLGDSRMDFSFARDFPMDDTIRGLLLENGWDGRKSLAVLNPAGAFVTRNWPLEKYDALMREWRQYDQDTQFVIMGLSGLMPRAQALKAEGGDFLIDLVGKTTIAQAYGIVLQSKWMLTEDSGLGHFAWMSGIPTVMLLGSTRSDWTAPVGAHTAFFDSSHLACGNCMRETCMYETVKCMEQIQVTEVLEKVKCILTQVLLTSSGRKS